MSKYDRRETDPQMPEARHVEPGPLHAERREPQPPARDQVERGSHGREPRNGGGWVRRHPAASVGGLIVLGLGLIVGYLWWDNANHFQTTDDAFIAARQFAVAPKVSGYLTAVPVTDNQHVAAGAVIARIDPRDYRAALDQANAQVTAAQADIASVDAQISAQHAQIDQARAQVDQAQAGLVFARQQAARYQDLARRGAGSLQSAQQYDSALRQQQAGVETAQAALVAAQRQVAALQAQRASDVAKLAQATAQREQATLNLGYTTVTAAQPGRLVKLTAAVGQYVSAGTALSMFVPDEVWVTANFKETQLDAMRPGQKVTIRVDAYPERAIQGHVASIQPGSGTAFSLLPAENATGNYVKIVQRVPVKIVLDNPPRDVSLGPGMSVEPSVRVDPSPSLYERLKGWL